jgi:N-acetyl-gamma-glutamyl-phosphate reductase
MVSLRQIDHGRIIISKDRTGANVTSIVVVGARGHVGAELIRCLMHHPHLRLIAVASRARAGALLREDIAEWPNELRYVEGNPNEVAALGADVVVLALPNGNSEEYASAIQARSGQTCIIDLSADHRFDESWVYGLPELNRSALSGAPRISNPGCYATAMQLAIAPLVSLLDGPVQCFGVSGYSGAGTTPSDKNNPELLRDNLMPYQLAKHVHEREVAHRLDTSIEFAGCR